MADHDSNHADDSGTVTTRTDELEGLESALAATPPAIAPLKPAPDTTTDRTTDTLAGDEQPPALERIQSDAVTPANARRLACPSCGAVWLAYGGPAPSARTSAAAFCPDCDFPLFWAAAGAEANRRAHAASRRRFPGVDGREALASLSCRNCGEPNPPDPHANCLRCGVALTPPPPPPPPPPEPETVYVVVPVSQRRWKIATAVVSVALAATIADLWWLVQR